LKEAEQRLSAMPATRREWEPLFPYSPNAVQVDEQRKVNEDFDHNDSGIQLRFA
jgi:hypothetical protein